MEIKAQDDSIKILLVEDNPGDVRLVLAALENAELSARVTVAKDGVDALAFLRGEGRYAKAPLPQLIVLDLNLPKKDGREVIREIQDDSRLRNIPVVILTTSEHEKEILSICGHGRNRYITKPFELDHFMAVGQSIKDFLAHECHVAVDGEKP